MFSKQNILRLLANTLLGIALILIWTHFIDLREVTKAILGVNPIYILSFMALFLLAGFFRSARLRLLLIKKQLTLKELIPLNYLCQFLSFIIPIRAGEIAKGMYLSNHTFLKTHSSIQPKAARQELLLRKSGISFAKSLVWVFLDRFLDFLGIVFIVAILVFEVPNNISANFQKFIAILLAFFLLGALLMIFSNKFSRRLLLFFSKLLIFPKLKKGFLNFSLSIAEEFPILFQSPLHFLGLAFLTILAIACDTINFYLLLTSVGVKIDFLKILLGSSLNTLSFLIPSAPGYIGSTEAAGLAVYSAGLGIPANLASSAVVLFHILNIVFIPLFGFISLYILKFDLKLVWRKLKRT